MADWARSLKLVWRYMLVDPLTWLDAYELRGVRSSEVRWSAATKTLVSSSMRVEDALPDWPYVRTYAEVTQGGVRERFAVATQLVMRSRDSSDGTRATSEPKAHSPLKEMDEDLPPVGLTLSGSVDEAIALCCSHTRAPLVPPMTGLALPAPIVCSERETWLDMLWAVADSVRLDVWVDGMGRISVPPKDDPWALRPILTLSDSDERGVLAADVERETDVADVPNHLEVVRHAADGMGGVFAEAWNRDPGSVASTASRGWVKTEREVDPDGLAPGCSQAEADAYAARRLRELSVVTRTYGARMGYVPLRLGDAARLVVSKLGCDEVVTMTGIVLGCDVAAEMRVTATSTREV